MRVLVTGNLGYIGPVIVRRLRQAGHHVTGVDTGWYIGQYAGDPVWPDVQHFADIRKPRDSWFIGVDAAVHLAGLSNDPMSEMAPEITRDVNYIGTAGMIVAGARNLVISSCSVYGAAEEATEETPVRPQTVYAECKAMVDDWMRNFATTIGAPSWASLRLGTVYGYSPGHRLDLVVNKMAYDALNSARVTATGNAARPLVHVEDVASAVLFMLERKDTGIYNVVGENTRMYTLGAAVADFAGVELVTLPADGDTRDYAASARKLKSLGWKPEHTVAGSLPVLMERTAFLPAGRIYQRLPIARKHLEAEVPA